MQRDKALILYIGFGLTIVICIIYILQPSLISSLELKVYDVLLKSRHYKESTEMVTIVAIDDKSLSRIGQWPWPRYQIARLLEALREMGALSIGIDILLAEPDRTSLVRIREQVKRDLEVKLSLSNIPSSKIDNDQILSDTLREGPFVLSYQFLFRDSNNSTECNIKPLNALIKGTQGHLSWQSEMYNPEGILCPFKDLNDSAGAYGFMNVSPDQDGLIRRVPLLMNYKGGIYANLSLSTLLKAANPSQIIMHTGPSGIEGLMVDEVYIPLNSKGSMLVSFTHPTRKFMHISASDILEGTIDTEYIKGKILLIGATAAGLKDIRATPVMPAMAGVEVHANVIDAILSGDYIIRPYSAPFIEFALMLILGAASTVLLASRGAIPCLLVFAGASVSVVVLSWVLMSRGFYISPMYPLIAYTANLSILSVLRFWLEEKRLKEKSRQLAVTQEVAIEAIANMTETRDPETGGHIKRTKRYVKMLAETLKKNNKFQDIINDDYIEMLCLSAPLHDIGKVGIPDRILLKPGRFTDEEFSEIKKHPVYGKRVIDSAVQRLGENSFLKLAGEMAYCHQEKWDGSGYPQGLKGDDIPLSGRLMAVADVYDALVSNRVYKKGLSHKEAVEIIRQGRGIHFDPHIIDAFMSIQEEFLTIALNAADDERQRISLMGAE